MYFIYLFFRIIDRIKLLAPDKKQIGKQILEIYLIIMRYVFLEIM